MQISTNVRACPKTTTYAYVVFHFPAMHAGVTAGNQSCIWKDVRTVKIMKLEAWRMGRNVGLVEKMCLTKILRLGADEVKLSK